MKHLILLFYLLSFSSGIGSISVAVFLYFQYKKSTLKFFSLILFSLSLMMLTLTLNKYIDIASIELPLYLKDYTSMIYILACLLFIITFPLFINTLLALEMSRIKKIVFFGADTIILLSGMYYLVFIDQRVMSYLVKPALQLALLYGFVMIIINLRAIGDRILKKSILIFFILTLVVWPLFIIEIYRDKIELLKDFHEFELFTLPLYFFLINVLAIVFSLRYLKRPVYWTDGSLSNYFNETYSITEREKIIISYLVDGLNNTEISKKLFISVKTVENHLSNIYSKVGIKNRVQLVNLILTNKQ